MLPITEHLSCTDPLDNFDSLSYHQTHHAKSYVTGLIAASNKTIDGISRHVMPSKGERALNKFVGEYDWKEEQLNLERLEELQQHNETRWSKNGYIVIDDSFTEKTGEEIPNVGRFYDHSEGDYIWGQNLVYTYYTDDKTGYPLGFRLYEKDAETKIELAKQLIEAAEQEAAVPAETYLFDSWYCASDLVEAVESHGKDWISTLKSDRQVTFAGEDRRIDAVHEMVELAEREIDGDTYHVWTQMLPVSKLGDVKVIVAEKEVEDGDNPVQYLVTNKIDAPSAHVISSYGYRWRIETFFEDSKQDLGFADCEVTRSTSARRHWQLVMLAYSLLRLGPADSASRSIRQRASSLRTDWERSIQEAVYNLVSWVREQSDRAIDQIVADFDDLFINVRS